MSNKNKSNSKQVKEFVVKWFIDGTHTILKYDDLILKENEELEIHGVYDAKWKNEILRVELIYAGDPINCKKNLDDICEDRDKREMIQKNIPKKKKNITRVQNKKALLNDESKENSTVQNETEGRIITQNSRPVSSSIHISKSTQNLVSSKINQKKDSNEPTSSNSASETDSIDRLSDKYLEQLEERNVLIQQLKNDKDELFKECRHLRDQLNLSKTLSDSEFTNKMVEIGIQIVKHLATSSQKEEIRQFCLNTDQIAIHSSFPTVTVTQIQYDRFMMHLNMNKTPKAIFKIVVVVLLPDWTMWGTKLAQTIREENPVIMNAIRAFMHSKNVLLTEAEFKTSIRDLCSRGKEELLNPKKKGKKNEAQVSSKTSASPSVSGLEDV